MKKAIYMFVLGILFLASSGLASAAWNTYPSDCPNALSIGNYTTGEGIQDGSNGCWSKKSVSASAGQTINVAVYYDNTNGTDANNTVISLTQSPTGSMSSKNRSYTFSGSLTSSSGSLYLSPVSVNLSSSETLTFSQAKWFKKGAQSGISLPGGQDGSGVFGSGVSLANITDGDWGTVLFSFSVGTTLAPQVCQDVSAPNYLGALPCIYPAQLCKDTTATNYNGALPCTYPQLCKDTGALNYNGTLPCTYPQLCKDVNANNYNGSLPCTFTKTYTITATAGVGGSISPSGITSYTYPNNSKFYGVTANSGYTTKEILVDGVPKPLVGGYAFYNISANHVIHANFTQTQVAKTCYATLYASDNSITKGESAVLTWGLTDCTNATLYPTVGAIYSSNSQNVYPTSSTLYTLTAHSYNGASITRTVTVNVTEPVVICQDSSASNYRSVGTCVYPPQLCKDTSASNYNGAIPCTYPPQLCQDSSASNYRSVGACIYNKTENTVLNVINSNNNNSVNNSNNTTTNNTVVVPTTCQNQLASNFGGLLPCNFNQTVNNHCEITSFSASDTSIQDGDSTILRWNTTDCDHVKLSGYSGNVSLDGSKTVYPTDDTTYTLTAYDTDGTHQTDTIKIYVDSNNNNNNSNCSIDSFTASNTYVNQGNPVTLRWNTSNCNNISVSTIGTVYASGSQIVYPTYSTNYILTASNYNGGSQTRSVYVTVNQNIIPTPTPVYNKCAVTTVATNVNQNSAQLNGIITSSTGANTYFEYGTSVNLGYRTNSRYTNGNVNFSDMVSSLAPNTIYFFRMISDCSNGQSLGAIEVFRTLANQVLSSGITTKTIVLQGTTVVGTASPVILTITNKYEAIGQGDLIDYVVTYKNIGNVRLTRPMVQVVLPTNVTLVNASRGTYSIDNHTLSAPIEDLEAGQEGIIFLQARVDSVPLNNAQIVTTAILVYTSGNNAQENVMAYVLNVPRFMMVNTDGSVLGANAFFAGLMSIGLVGWLLILLLILLITLIARSYNKNNTSSESKTITRTTTLQ